MTRHRLRPTFNPAYQVHYFPEEGCVFFLNEYPFPSLFIADARLFKLLSLIDGTKRSKDLAQSLAPRFSTDQVEDVLAQLHRQKLVVFR